MADWEKRYLETAKHVAQWSRDPSRKIGAIIIGEDKQIVSQGFNGFARGVADTEYRYSDKETKYKFVVHAEMNAIFNAALSGARVKGGTIYVTGLHVCHACADGIIQSGINKVVMESDQCKGWEESAEIARIKFKEAGVQYEYANNTD